MRQTELIGGAVLLALLLSMVLVPVGGATDTEQQDGDFANVTLYAAETTEFDGVDGIRAAIDNGTVEPADAMLASETLVIGIESERLADDLATRSGSPTDRFFDVLAGDAALGIQQHPDFADPMTEPWQRHLERNHTAVYYGDTTTYVAVPVTTPSAEDKRAFTIAFGYGVEFGFGESQRYLDPNDHPTMIVSETSASVPRPRNYKTWSVLGPGPVYGPVEVAVPPDRELAVRATFDDGSAITDTLSGAPSSDPFTYHEFSLNLTAVAPGSTYTIELIRDGTVVERHNGTVHEHRASLREPSVVLLEDGRTPAELHVTATLSHGGFVEVFDETGERVGTSGTPLEPGTETELSIDIPSHTTDEFSAEQLRVTAIRVADLPYENPGSELVLDVSDRNWNESEGGGTTPTPTATPPSTPTATPTETPTAGGTPTNTADDGGPGFGPLVALGSLAGIGWLFGRRGADE